MNIKRIVILGLIFICLAGYVYFFERRPMDRIDNEPLVKIKKALQFDPEQVEEIALGRRSESILFKLEGGQWWVLNPLRAKAKNNRVRDLLSIFDYGIVRVLATNATDLSQYGLERPEIEVGIRVKGNNKFQTLMIGDKNPSNTSCYAMEKGRSRVVLIGSRYKEEFERKLEFFME